jgi:hypothetical protein
MNIFDKVRKLKLPIGKYVVVGGVMEAHGIRPARDIDIVVAKDLFDELSKNKWSECRVYPKYYYGIKKILKKEGLDVISHYSFEDKYYCPLEELVKNADIINGIPFAPIAELLKWKKTALREKDKKDIILIENYLNTKTT